MARTIEPSPHFRHNASDHVANRPKLTDMPHINRPTNDTHGDQIKRHRSLIKIAATQWIFGVWLVLVVLARPDRHVGALTELHIGGIFPIGGKGGWQGNWN